jgi:very-short-patch-repair endonuclease
MLSATTELNSSGLYKSLTDAENALWQAPRMRQTDGVHFLRQQCVGDYIVVLYLPARTLDIELSGGRRLERGALTAP